MITEHPSFKAPPDAAISVWHYTQTNRLLWALENNSLHFSRVDLFNDQEEGFYTRALEEWDEFFDPIMPKDLDRFPVGKQIRRDTRIAHLRAQTQMIRRSAYVHCWSMNTTECHKMWKGRDVCIRSDYSTLSKVLPTPSHLGCIVYIDMERDRIDTKNALNLVMRKDREKYSFERELRAIIWKPVEARLPYPPNGEFGIVVPVKLNQLVKEIRVAPCAGSALRDLVESRVRGHGLDVSVKRSELMPECSEEPLFG